MALKQALDCSESASVLRVFKGAALKGKSIRLEPGEILFHEGDASDKLYIIQEGRFEIFREREGAAVVLGKLGPHDVLGTVTLLTMKPRTASARAVTAARVFCVSPRTLRRDLKPFPIWVQVIIKDTIARLMHVNDMFVESRLSERRLARQVGNQLQHTSQLLQYIISLDRAGRSNEVPVEFFGIDGFVKSAERVLCLSDRYLKRIVLALCDDKLLKLLTPGGKGEGFSIVSSEECDAFSEYCSRVARFDEPVSLAASFPEEVELLVKTAESKAATEVIYWSTLEELYKTHFGEKFQPRFFEELRKLDILQRAEYPPGALSLEANAVKNRLHFDSVVKSLIEVRMPDVFSDAA